MCLGHDIFARRVGKTVGQTAHLGALAAVGATACGEQAGIAVAAVADAESAVDEGLEVGVGRFADCPDFVERELACKHDAAESGVGEKARFLGVAGVTLGARVERYRRHVVAEERHILHDEGVDADAVKLTGEGHGVVDLVVVEDGVERDEHSDVEAVGIVDDGGDVGDAVAGGGACAESRRAYVDGVGAVVDGRDGGGGVFGRCE